MRKYKESITVLLVYITLIVLGLMFCSCRTLYVGSKYSNCPSNNKSFFYDRMGVKPSKQFLKFGRL